jgi:hypothetical protein
MRILTTAIALGCFTGGLASGQQIPRPEVPTKIAAPANENVVLAAHASGSQIYSCQEGADQKLAWTLKTPEADLADAKGSKIGTHFAGPTWKHTDGSEVTGKAAAREDSPEPGAVPWLLLNVTGHTGEGVLARVTSIQRIHTKGGQAPATGCDDAHRGSEIKIPYTADYYFFAPRK